MNLLAVAYFFCALFCLVFATFVLGRHDKSPTRDAFLLQLLFAFIWQMGTFFVLTSSNPQIATTLSRIAYSGCIFLSVASYHLVVNFLSLKSQKKFVILGYVLGSVVFIPLLFTNYFLETAYAYPWGYWFHAGKLHPLYLLFFTVYGASAFINLLAHALKIPDKVERGKCWILFGAYFICYFSVIDFFPNYGYAVRPLGFVFVTIFLLILLFVIKLYDSLYMWEKIILVNDSAEENQRVNRA
jgi:hypothetical protein